MNRLDWLIEEYPGDRFVLELLERIFCLLWKESNAWGNTDSTSSQVLLVEIYYCDEQRCMERGNTSPSNMFNEEFGTLNFI